MKILVIGHVSHGKTTFISALNKVLFTKYGIGNEESIMPTINAAGEVIPQESTHYFIDDIEYAFYDYPGYGDYLNMFESGQESFDAALLVCDASSGAMPQTFDLLQRCQKIGIDKFVVLLSMLDLVPDPELIELISFDITSQLEENGCSPSTPIFSGSSLNVLESSDENAQNFISNIMFAFHKMLA